MAEDREADFRAWVVHHRQRLRTTAYLLCGDWYLADDLVQDALGRVFSIWDRVAASGDPRPYVNRILCNLYHDFRRRPARREISRPDVYEEQVDQGVSRGDRDDDLLIALRAVPAGQRTVLVLRFYEDLSIEQTAALLNMSPGAVKSQTSRGLQALREALPARPKPI